MKTYTDYGAGLQDAATGDCYPKDPTNDDYARALAEVAAGRAAVVEAEPAPEPERRVTVADVLDLLVGKGIISSADAEALAQGK